MELAKKFAHLDAVIWDACREGLAGLGRSPRAAAIDGIGKGSAKGVKLDGIERQRNWCRSGFGSGGALARGEPRQAGEMEKFPSCNSANQQLKCDGVGRDETHSYAERDANARDRARIK